MDEDGSMVEIWPPKRRRVGHSPKGRHQRHRLEDCPPTEFRMDSVPTQMVPSHTYPPAPLYTYSASADLVPQSSFEYPIPDPNYNSREPPVPYSFYDPICISWKNNVPVLEIGHDSRLLPEQDVTACSSEDFTPQNLTERKDAVSHETRRSLFRGQSSESSHVKKSTSRISTSNRKKKEKDDTIPKTGKSRWDAKTEIERRKLRLDGLQKMGSKSSRGTEESNSSNSSTCWFKCFKRKMSTKSNETHTSNTSQDSFEAKDKRKKGKRSQNLRQQRYDEAQATSSFTDSFESNEMASTLEEPQDCGLIASLTITFGTDPNIPKAVPQQESKKLVKFASLEKVETENGFDVKSDKKYAGLRNDDPHEDQGGDAEECVSLGKESPTNGQILAPDDAHANQFENTGEKHAMEEENGRTEQNDALAGKSDKIGQKNESSESPAAEQFKKEALAGHSEKCVPAEHLESAPAEQLKKGPPTKQSKSGALVGQSKKYVPAKHLEKGAKAGKFGKDAFTGLKKRAPNEQLEKGAPAEQSEKDAPTNRLKKRSPTKQLENDASEEQFEKGALAKQFKSTDQKNNATGKVLEGPEITLASCGRVEVSEKNAEVCGGKDELSKEQKNLENKGAQAQSMTYDVSSEPKLIHTFKLPLSVPTGGFQQNLFVIYPQDLLPSDNVNTKSATGFQQEPGDENQSTENPVTQPEEAVKPEQNAEISTSSQKNQWAPYVPEVQNPVLQIVETNRQNVLLAHPGTTNKFIPCKDAHTVILKQEAPSKKLLTDESTKEFLGAPLKPGNDFGRTEDQELCEVVLAVWKQDIPETHKNEPTLGTQPRERCQDVITQWKHIPHNQKELFCPISECTGQEESYYLKPSHHSDLEPHKKISCQSEANRFTKQQTDSKTIPANHPDECSSQGHFRSSDDTGRWKSNAWKSHTIREQTRLDNLSSNLKRNMQTEQKKRQENVRKACPKDSSDGLEQTVPNSPSVKSNTLQDGAIPLPASGINETPSMHGNFQLETGNTVEKSTSCYPIQQPLPVFQSLQNDLPGTYWTPIHIESRMPLCFSKVKNHKSSQPKTDCIEDSNGGSNIPFRKASYRTGQRNLTESTGSSVGKKSFTPCFASKCSIQKKTSEGSKASSLVSENSASLQESSCCSTSRTSSEDKSYQNAELLKKKRELHRRTSEFPTNSSSVFRTNFPGNSNPLQSWSPSGTFGSMANEDNRGLSVSASPVPQAYDIPNTTLLLTAKNCSHKTRMYDDVSCSTREVTREQTGYSSELSGTCLLPKRSRSAGDERRSKLHHRSAKRFSSNESFQSAGLSRTSLTRTLSKSTSAEDLASRGRCESEAKMLRHPWSRKNYTACTCEPWKPSRKSSKAVQPPLSYSIPAPLPTLYQMPTSSSQAPISYHPSVTSPLPIYAPKWSSNQTHTPKTAALPCIPYSQQLTPPMRVACVTCQPHHPITSTPSGNNWSGASEQQITNQHEQAGFVNDSAGSSAHSPPAHEAVSTESAFVEPGDPSSLPTPPEEPLQPTVSFSISSPEDSVPSFPRPPGMQPVSLVFIPVPTVLTPSFGPCQSYPAPGLENAPVKEEIFPAALVDENPDTAKYILDKPEGAVSQEVHDDIDQQTSAEPDVPPTVEPDEPKYIKQQEVQPESRTVMPLLADGCSGIMAAQSASLRFLQLLAVAAALAVALEVSTDLHNGGLVRGSLDNKEDLKESDTTPHSYFEPFNTRTSFAGPSQTRLNQPGEDTAKPTNLTQPSASKVKKAGVDGTHDDFVYHQILPNSSTVPTRKVADESEVTSVSYQELPVNRSVESESAKEFPRDFEDFVLEDAQSKRRHHENSTAGTVQNITEAPLPRITESIAQGNANATDLPVRSVTESDKDVSESVSTGIVHNTTLLEILTESFRSGQTQGGTRSASYPSDIKSAQTSIPGADSAQFTESTPQITLPPSQENFTTIRSKETIPTLSTSSKPKIEESSTENGPILQTDSSGIPATTSTNATSYEALDEASRNLNHASSENPVHTDHLSPDKLKLKKKSRFYVPKTGDINKHVDKKSKDVTLQEIQTNFSEKSTLPEKLQKHQIYLDLIAFYDNFYNDALNTPWTRLLTLSNLNSGILYLTIFLLAGYAALLMLQIFIVFNGGRNVCRCSFVMFGLQAFALSGAYFIITGHTILGGALILLALLFFIEVFYLIFLCASKFRG